MYNTVYTIQIQYTLQLQEAEQEAEAQRQRGDAAELALQNEKRQRRAAEHARSRPTSPLRDAALHADLASLRDQVMHSSCLPGDLESHMTQGRLCDVNKESCQAQIIR